VISDASLATIKQAVRDFEQRIKGAEMEAFFFGGHGIETGGKKYIIPIDAQLKAQPMLKKMPTTSKYCSSVCVLEEQSITHYFRCL
jgi:uncharacterized caspase-like protein